MGDEEERPLIYMCIYVYIYINTRGRFGRAGVNLYSYHCIRRSRRRRCLVDQRTRGPRNELTPTFPFCGPGAASSVSLWLTEQRISSGLRSRNLQRPVAKQNVSSQSRRGLVNPLSAGAADVVRPPTLSLPGPGISRAPAAGHRGMVQRPCAQLSHLYSIIATGVQYSTRMVFPHRTIRVSASALYPPPPPAKHTPRSRP
jgi:hypothetical protein